MNNFKKNNVQILYSAKLVEIFPERLTAVISANTISLASSLEKDSSLLVIRPKIVVPCCLPRKEGHL
jgi:hypothetical protein